MLGRGGILVELLHPSAFYTRIQYPFTLFVSHPSPSLAVSITFSLGFYWLYSVAPIIGWQDRFCKFVIIIWEADDSHSPPPSFLRA